MARKANPVNTRKVWAIVGDGSIEQIYFQHLKNEESLRDIDIRPELPSRSGKGGGFMKVFASVDNQVKLGYDKVFCLIDLDKVIEEGKQVQYEREKSKARAKGVVVLENNPCFEFWLLLHFKTSGRHFTCCDDVVRDLKRHLPSYLKTLEYHRRENLYKKLKVQMIEKAIPNAKQLERDRKEKDDRHPRGEVYKLIEQLLEETRPQKVCK